MKQLFLMKKHTTPYFVCFLSALLLSACTSTIDGKYTADKSYLTQSDEERRGLGEDNEVVSSEAIKDNSRGMKYISPLMLPNKSAREEVDLTEKFSDSEFVEISAEQLPLKDYLHYVLGDMLGVSYILGDKVKGDNQTITLNIQNSVSQRRLFTISESLLAERGYVIRFDDGIYYIHSVESANKGDVVYGYGNQINNVPETSLDIIQLVPFEFGMQVTLANTLSKIVKVKATADFDRNAIMLQGKRREVIKALEFINLMDQPLLKDRFVGIYNSVYVSVEDLLTKIPELLQQEGISTSQPGRSDKAVSLVALDRVGSLIVFAQNEFLLKRAEFWFNQIDQPPSGDEFQYFIYQPLFARATDLGESLQLLIGGTNGQQLGDSTSAQAQNNQSKAKNIKSSSARSSASSDTMKLVIDERANSLIFHTPGDSYRQLLPLIKRLDVMPKQVILEVMIAEVTLTDEFKQGVEFALSKGNYSLSTKGAFMGDGFGGLSYLLKGGSGQLAIDLLETNSLVNIVSRPSVVVRDGVNASITVGTDIPVIGATTTDPDGQRQTTAVEYRKTGVELDVLPTINAQGVILMEIRQKISNEVDAGGTAAISPSIFERTITTEVVAQSGQTILLGGLISENRSKKESKVPFFGNLPLIGGLFRANTDGGDKTELVVLVTPRVIETADEWDNIKLKFSSSLTELEF
tara:strand:- start:25024 stop:27096 length:2073 start_codon:yes stop_codon:yes gene_type:complete